MPPRSRAITTASLESADAMGGRIALTLLLVIVFGGVLVAVNPWRSFDARHRVRHPFAIAAWWAWVATILFLLALTWSATWRGWLGS